MKYTFLCCLILLLGSCSTVSYINVDMRKPAQVTIPSSIKTLAIVNNAAAQPYGEKHEKIAGLDTIPTIVSTDSLNIILTQAMAQFIQEESFYDNVIWYDKELRSDSLFLTETLIDSVLLKNIFLETGADAIFSLDRLSVSTKQHFIIVNKKKHEKKNCVTIDARFRLYLPQIYEPFGPVSYGDQICWERSFDDWDTIPSPEKIARDIILIAADKMSAAMVPSWKTETRRFYTNGTSPMKKASMKASANEWREAAKMWGDLFDAEKKDNKKAKLAINIALANEMLDDIENAITWVDIAIEYFTPIGQEDKTDKQAASATFSDRRISIGTSPSRSSELSSAKSYKKRLEKRLSDFKLLDLQIGKEN